MASKLLTWPGPLSGGVGAFHERLSRRVSVLPAGRPTTEGRRAALRELLGYFERWLQTIEWPALSVLLDDGVNDPKPLNLRLCAFGRVFSFGIPVNGSPGGFCSGEAWRLCRLLLVGSRFAALANLRL